MDAASLLKDLVELTKAGGIHMMSGFGLDYQKCFDMMPQLIVFALARALGMHEDVLRPLQAMYKQLKRAFRFVGCSGSWFRATNGVLHGCPCRRF